METALFIVAVCLGTVMVSVSGYFTWKQFRILRDLKAEQNLPPEDRSYVYKQAWRRLISCALMMVVACLLSSSFFTGLETQATRLAEQRSDPTFTLSPEDKQFLKLYGAYWIAVLLLVLAIVILAGVDIWAIRRYGNWHRGQIQDDQIAMLENQLARLRSQRNGHV